MLCWTWPGCTCLNFMSVFCAKTWLERAYSSFNNFLVYWNCVLKLGFNELYEVLCILSWHLNFFEFYLPCMFKFWPETWPEFFFVCRNPILKHGLIRFVWALTTQFVCRNSVLRFGQKRHVWLLYMSTFYPKTWTSLSVTTSLHIGILFWHLARENLFEFQQLLRMPECCLEISPERIYSSFNNFFVCRNPVVTFS